MKIRNGFVSNSSSSSFIVAFPKKPESFADVYEMMFHSQEGGIQPYDWHEGMSHTQVAHRVWDDIQTKMTSKWDHKRVPAKKGDIAEEFANRYYYTTADHNVFWVGKKNDEYGGAWSEPIGPYYGRDKIAMDSFRELVITSEAKEQELRDKMHKIIQNEFKLVQPKFAYAGGKNSKTGKPYTKAEIKAYEDYNNALDKFKNEHKEYQALHKESMELSQKQWKGEEMLRTQIAKADTEAFLKDNKGAFIVILSYADDGGESTLEHGDIFKNLPHIRVSHH